MILTIKLNGKEIESMTIPNGYIEIELDGKTICQI